MAQKLSTFYSWSVFGCGQVSRHEALLLNQSTRINLLATPKSKSTFCVTIFARNNESAELSPFTDLEILCLLGSLVDQAGAKNYTFKIHISIIYALWEILWTHDFFSNLDAKSKVS